MLIIIYHIYLFLCIDNDGLSNISMWPSPPASMFTSTPHLLFSLLIYRIYTEWRSAFHISKDEIGYYVYYPELPRYIQRGRVPYRRHRRPTHDTNSCLSSHKTPSTSGAIATVYYPPLPHTISSSSEVGKILLHPECSLFRRTTKDSQ